MKKRDERDTLAYREKVEFFMCKKKRKFKSSEAGRVAGKLKQRKYECPICGHWHLTKKQRGYR